MQRLLASTHKAKKLINWKPKYSSGEGFNTGLKTIKWFSNEDTLKLYKENIFND